jgi:hypothetical protein
MWPGWVLGSSGVHRPAMTMLQLAAQPCADAACMPAGRRLASVAAVADMACAPLQAFDNIRTVRSFAGEALERERFHEHVASSFKAGVKFAGGGGRSWLLSAGRLGCTFTCT